MVQPNHFVLPNRNKSRHYDKGEPHKARAMEIEILRNWAIWIKKDLGDMRL